MNRPHSRKDPPCGIRLTQPRTSRRDARREEHRSRRPRSSKRRRKRRPGRRPRDLSRKPPAGSAPSECACRKARRSRPGIRQAPPSPPSAHDRRGRRAHRALRRHGAALGGRPARLRAPGALGNAGRRRAHHGRVRRLRPPRHGAASRSGARGEGLRHAPCRPSREGPQALEHSHGHLRIQARAYARGHSRDARQGAHRRPVASHSRRRARLGGARHLQKCGRAQADGRSHARRGSAARARHRLGFARRVVCARHLPLHVGERRHRRHEAGGRSLPRRGSPAAHRRR